MLGVPVNVIRAPAFWFSSAPSPTTCAATVQLPVFTSLSLRISSGATFKAALDYSKENANKGLRIVVLSTDSGEKYLSNAYNY